MSVALHGNLQDFGIAEVFQLIGQQRKTGVLEVEHGKRKLCIHFDEGSVVLAETRGATGHEALADMLVRCGLLTRERANAIAQDSLSSARAYHVVAVEGGDVPASELERIIDLLTQEVIFEVLRFTSGSFHFVARPVDHDRPPEKLLGAEQILMEGLRMVDEWRTFAAHVPSPTAIAIRCGTFEDFRERAGSEARDALARVESIFQLVDGRLSVGRIIDLSRAGTFEGTRALAALVDARAIELREPILPPMVRSERGGLAGFASGAQFALSATVPLLLLALVLWASGQRLWEQAEPPGTPIEVRSFERAAASFETRRLRHALEAHRHLWSAWPTELAAVERTGWQGSNALAAPHVGSYYYAQRGDGVVLLPPDSGSTR